MAQMTANLALPLIAAAQASKHVTHNEALTGLDTLVQLACLDKDLTAPPANPAEGDRYLVAAPTPTGAWAGLAGQIVRYQDGRWLGFPPRAGWFAWIVDEGDVYTYSGSAWTSFRATLGALQNLSRLGLGTTADAANPFAAKLNAALWTARTQAEGGSGDLRYTLNKETSARTLSLLFQTGFSARAEIGLLGDDDLHLKVSPEGTGAIDALRISRANGAVAHVAGSASAPALTPAGDSNTGTFSPGADIWAVATNGVERLRIGANGRLGLGTATPRTALDTGLGTLSGAAADYGLAQAAMSGGGTITWGGAGGLLRWTGTIYTIPGGATTFAAGYIGINLPTADIPAEQCWDGVARGVSSAGIVLNGWEALYAVHVPGAGSTGYTLRIVYFNAAFTPASNWILIAVVNAADGTLRLGSGPVLKPGGSWTAGTDAQYAPRLPSPDNGVNLGGPANRFATLYAGTGTINTSDAREKTALAPLTPAEIAASRAIASVIGTFRFLEAVEAKGGAARLHVGLTVQDAVAIMEAHGLDPFAYGFVCHDSWDHDSWDGEPGGRAGDRYGFRTDEVLMFLARGFSARLDALEAART